MSHSNANAVDYLHVMCSEFREMPGLCLTKPQAQRLWGLDPLMCEALLDALVDAKFLQRTKNGVYLRAGGDARLRPSVRQPAAE